MKLERKTDRRIDRTRRQLKDALFSLILEKGYDGVTIEDITERAELGRTTFYLHYKDKAGLLLESIDAIADDLLSQAASAGLLPPVSAATTILTDGSSQVQPIQMVFQHAYDNAELWRIILRGEGAPMASRRIREIVAEIAGGYFTEQMKTSAGAQEQAIPVEVAANYFAGSLLGFLTWWVENGMPYLPIETALMFRNLVFNGVSEAAGLPRRE